MRIDVLPLRKLPNTVAVLSYESPEPVNVGQLVEIPFRGRPMLGVVWNTNSTYEGKTQPIKKVFPNTVMNSIQRALIEQLQTSHAVSAASLLYQHWPANRVVQKLLVPENSSPTPKATHTYFWYADRERILTEQANYISELQEVTAILVPTHEHAKDWQTKFPEALILTSESSAKERNIVYQKTASGEARIVIGTADLLFLPYTTWPVWEYGEILRALTFFAR
jgi:primosomal protein N'